MCDMKADPTEKVPKHPGLDAQFHNKIKEPSMLEKLYFSRSQLEKQLENVNIAIKTLQSEPESEAIIRKLMRGGAC